eukprot:COSAG02_NODE_7514_length_2977_cov_1.808895_3_plen_89_part_00
MTSYSSDCSGTLDRAELQALASALGTTLSDHEISEAMAQVDKDGDGSVNLEEFMEWWEFLCSGYLFQLDRTRCSGSACSLVRFVCSVY